MLSECVKLKGECVCGQISVAVSELYLALKLSNVDGKLPIFYVERVNLSNEFLAIGVWVTKISCQFSVNIIDGPYEKVKKWPVSKTEKWPLLTIHFCVAHIVQFDN